MEIYLLEISQVQNGADLEPDPKAFRTEEEACQALKEFADDERKYVKGFGWKISADEYDHFQAYEEGYYCMNHSEAAVRLLEVRD